MAEKSNPAVVRALPSGPPNEPGERGEIDEPRPPPIGLAASGRHPTLVPSGEIVGWLESGLAILDGNGRVTEINETFTHWLDQPAAEVVGQVLWDLLAAQCAEWREPLDAFQIGRAHV